MTGLARARARVRRHHLTTAPIKLGRRNAYFRARSTVLSLLLSLSVPVSVCLNTAVVLITVKQLNAKVSVIIATTIMTTVIPVVESLLRILSLKFADY